MTAAAGPFQVVVADYATAFDALRAVREVVFVQGQGVPVELELDALDPRCRHVLARDPDGLPIGTARLTGSGSGCFVEFASQSAAEQGRSKLPKELRARVAAGVARSPLLDALEQH